MEELTRRQIRYICFRLQTEVRGGVSVKDIKEAKEVKAHMESQADFGGWEKFGVTWDVDEKAHLVVVTRKKSLESEWDAVVEKEVHDLPLPEVEESDVVKEAKGFFGKLTK